MKNVNKNIIRLTTIVILTIAIICIYKTVGILTGIATMLGFYPAIFILFVISGFKFAKIEDDRTKKQCNLFIVLCITMLLFGIFHVDTRK